MRARDQPDSCPLPADAARDTEMEGSMTPHGLLAELNSPQQMDRLMEERAEFVSMVKMQQLVRVTCLEVMKGPPDQIEAYRREVIELKTLVQGYLSEVRELRAQGGGAAAPSHPPTPDTASLRSSAPSSPGPPLATLEARFEVAPTTGWYEHKPMPPFSVRLTLPSGEPYPTDDEVVLRVSMLNGRGHREESRANGSGELLSGERDAVVRNGVAEWTTLRVCEPSSKHYASFTLCVSAVKLPDGHGLDELRAPPMTVQVGRMWSKRRKAESELGPDDPITQIPGVGARYVSRLQLQGVTTIGQFAAMAATAAGRDTLCKLCKGDNPRNSLNQAKLQAMIDARTRRPHAPQARTGPQSDPSALTITASDASGCGGSSESAADDLDTEPSFSMDELMLLASPDGSDSFASGRPPRRTSRLSSRAATRTASLRTTRSYVIEGCRRWRWTRPSRSCPKERAAASEGWRPRPLAAGDSPYRSQSSTTCRARTGRLAPGLGSSRACPCGVAWRRTGRECSGDGRRVAVVGHDRFGCTAVTSRRSAVTPTSSPRCSTRPASLRS